MVNNNNTYNQPQMPPQPPMPQGGAFVPPMPPRPKGWRERMMRQLGMDTAMQSSTKGALTIPNWIVGKSIVFFFVSMIACWMVFGYVPALDLWLVASISVVLFFYGGVNMSKSWAGAKEKRFLRNVFVAGFVIRLIWLLYVWYFFNFEHYGASFGEQADTTWYMPFAHDLAKWITGDSPFTFAQIVEDNGAAIDDIGYPLWLAIGYTIWGEWSDAFIPMLIKCVVSAYCSICVYRIAKRHFGQGTARMAAIFVCVNPNMIYWCGNMFKEAEMVFIVCVAVDLIDKALTSGKKLTFKSLLPGIAVGFYLFFFRSALGLVVFLAIIAHIVMASERVMSMGKKVLAGVLVAVTLFVGVGDRLRSQTEHMVNSAQSDAQARNMEWRSERKDGSNSFAKYASAAVFAPLIFTIPFPTFNQAEATQYLQMQLAGGSYIKNIFSFFVILVMFMMLISGEWRRHVFILAYTVGYVAILVISSYAQSGRFHMPIWPMLMLFAAYGIQIAKTNARVRKWWPMVLVLEVIACLAWNWFKLKGRGMI